MERKRIRLTVAYDGTNYHGWQLQPNGITIESVLNRALSGGYYMDSHTMEIKQDGFDKPGKAFLIYDYYGVAGFPVVYDGYILQNYGSTYS